MRIGSNIQCVMANFIFCMYMFFINMENYCTFIHVLMNSSKTNGTDYQVHVFIHMCVDMLSRFSWAEPRRSTDFDQVWFLWSLADEDGADV